MSEQFDSFLADFVLDAQERCDRLEELLIAAIERDGTERDTALDDAKRELHTLKGNAGMMGLKELQSAAHQLEDRVAGTDPHAPEFRALLAEVDAYRRLVNEAAASGTDEALAAAVAAPRNTLRTVRVEFTALDELVDLLAEMVVFRNRLDDAIQRADPTRRTDEWQRVAEAQDALSKTLAIIQDRIMAVRMVPLRALFGPLRRIVHDESGDTAKQVHFEADGGETPMDKALLECASEALGHLVRNAVVHGIERPSVRLASGKRIEGTIRLAATTHSDEVTIEVSDDGAGIDRDAVLASAMARGINIAGVRDALELLFHSGMTTRADSDMSSGRGMGLSAALEAVRRVGGDIEVVTAAGKGTTFRLRMPLSVSIMRALTVRADGEDYALPLASIAESIRLREGDAHLINNAGVVNWRGKVLPLLDLGLVMGSCTELRTGGFVVVIEGDGKQRGIIVDDLSGMREIVVKGLGEIGSVPRGIAGATILGDGRVLLILDPKSLIGMSPLLDGTDPAARGVAA